MKKRVFLTPLVSLLTLVAVVLFFNWQASRAQNIFDEMYDSQEAAYPSSAQFFTSDDFNTYNFRDTIFEEKEDTFMAVYKNHSIPPNYTDITFDFNVKAKEKSLHIWFNRRFQDGIVVSMDMYYDVDKRTVKKKCQFFARAGERAKIH